MLGSFRLRMLIVIVIAALAGLSMQADHGSKKIIEPVLEYVLKDYGVEQKVAAYIKNVGIYKKEETVPVMSDVTLQKPCEYSAIKSSYGWYWNRNKERQEFSPGVRLQVEDNSLVRPVLEGKVEKISEDREGRMILIKHGDRMFSLYGDLKEVLVEKDAVVSQETVLGKTTDSFYFELRDDSGPINSQAVFE